MIDYEELKATMIAMPASVCITKTWLLYVLYDIWMRTVLSNYDSRDELICFKVVSDYFQLEPKFASMYVALKMIIRWWSTE